MRDDKLVPVFCQALIESGQQHVAIMLGCEGLHAFAAKYLVV